MSWYHQQIHGTSPTQNHSGLARLTLRRFWSIIPTHQALWLDIPVCPATLAQAQQLPLSATCGMRRALCL